MKGIVSKHLFTQRESVCVRERETAGIGGVGKKREECIVRGRSE